MLILERCKESAVSVKAVSVKDIFDKTIPPNNAARAERYKKAARVKLKSNKVTEHMEEVVKNMELIAQHQFFEDADTLKDIQEAVEQFTHIPNEEPAPRFVPPAHGQ